MTNKKLKQKGVHLKAMDLDVNISERISYFDDGFVDIIEAHVNFLGYKYTGDLSFFTNTDFPPVGGKRKGGMLLIPQSEGRYSAHIFYTHNSNPVLENFARAHEETHFLHAVKRLSLLEEVARKTVGVEIPFDNFMKISDKFERKETIANLGGFFSVHKNYGIEKVKDLPSYFEGYETRSIYLGLMNKTLERVKNGN